MVNSMTAFARAQLQALGLQLSWELRSVNHRFLEAGFRMPEQLRGLEPRLRDTLRQHVKRGKIDAALKVEKAGGGNALELNRPLLLQLLAALEQVRRDAPEIGAINPMDLLRWPGIVGDNASLDDPALVEPIEDLFEAALTELIEHRGREGSKLAGAIVERLDDIDRIVADVRNRTLNASAEQASRLRQRLAELKVQVDDARLEQEVAILASRADVAEEIDRLAIHVEEARSTLRGQGPHGRRLDFLSQELNREANTLGSKSLTAELSQRAVDLKVIIEQIREQVQNLE